VRETLKRTLLILLLGAFLLGTVMLGRTLRLVPKPVSVLPVPSLELDERRVCERLGRALRIPSVSSREPSALDLARLDRMGDFVVESFPPLVEHLEFERHERCLVFRWRGTRPELAPLLLLAHLDVVPVDPRTEAEWSFPPFSGEIAGGYVWGRGALDDKGSAMAILEALELMLGRGTSPRRGVVVAIGLDEEIGGALGARVQAQRFAQEGLEPFMILDEGYGVLEGVVDLVASPIAGVGVAEKGLLTLELGVSATGGHASMPADQTSIGILSAALAALEREQLPARLDGAVGLFFDELAREMPFRERLLFANRWITEPLLLRALLEETTTAALVRTTTAVTTTSAGIADNVLPERARATVNFRVHTRDGVKAVIDHAREVIDDERVELSVIGESFEPSAISPAGGEPWELLERTIKECYPGVVVVPSLVVGATDARHYSGLSPNVYRFNGIRLGPEDLERIHGADERISTRNYLEMIHFYVRLIERG
jgi:carboxypeptidase PM20D1